MSNTKIILKKSSVAGKTPLATDLAVGELAINLADKKLYSKDGSNAVIPVGGQDFVGGTGISISGDTITNTAPHQATNLSYTASSRVLASSTGTNVTLPEATTSAAGLMSSGDKTKLNSLDNVNLTGGSNVTITGTYPNLTIASTDTNTTYSAGDGLTLSGTTFSLPVTTSGSGTFVTSITQTTNGITANLGTPPNTTYEAMPVAEGTTGTAITLRTMRADHLKQIIEHYIDSVARDRAINGSFYESDNVITQNYTIETGRNSMVAGPITVNDGVTITIPDGSTLIVV